MSILFRRLPYIVFYLILIISCLLSTAGCKSTPEEKLPTIVPWERPTVSTEDILRATAEPDADGVQLVDVGMVENGAMVIVNFRGPAALIDKWNQGSIYLVDETTGIACDQIAVAPVIGPLFAKPKADGQPGYAILNNPGNGIRSGMAVTVVLGNFKREHITVGQ